MVGVAILIKNITMTNTAIVVCRECMHVAAASSEYQR